MAIYRVQIGFPMDSALPKDVITLNPHYVGDNPQALADMLKANLIANTNVTVTTPFTVKVYDAVKPPPSYPLATAVNGTGFGANNVPRELALCLSYYSTYNQPRLRGRLYIPLRLIGAASIGLRPSAANITAVLNWGNTLGKGLPANTNLVVFSRKEQKAYGVSNLWVDDEWDVVRSRGLRGTTRQTAVLP
jgi:hypothetical protein